MGWHWVTAQATGVGGGRMEGGGLGEVVGLVGGELVSQGPGRPCPVNLNLTFPTCCCPYRQGLVVRLLLLSQLPSGAEECLLFSYFLSVWKWP